MNILARAAAAHNIPMQMLTVGSSGSRINPTTGAPEFGVMDWLGAAKRQVINATKDAALNSGIKLADYAAKGRRFFDNDFEDGESMHTVLPSGVGDPPQSMPSNRTLNYDESNPNMLEFVATNPWTSAKAVWHGLRAYQEARDRYEGGPDEATLYGGEGDAWRHARWNQRMANSFGPEKAKVFADYYEQLTNSNPGDRAMDLYNNQVGRNLIHDSVDKAGKIGDTTKGAIDELVRKGRLRTQPY